MLKPYQKKHYSGHQYLKEKDHELKISMIKDKNSLKTPQGIKFL